MKTLNLVFLVILIPFFHCSNPAEKQNEYTDECSMFFPYKDHYINLETNQEVEADIIPANDFKSCSKYAWRFREPLSDSVYVNGRSFVVEKNRDKEQYLINIYENSEFVKSIIAPTEKPLPEVHDYSLYLTVFEKDVILVMEDMYTTHYFICKYNTDGELLTRQDIEHTFITHPEPNTNQHHRYLYFHGIVGQQMVFTSHIAFAEKDKTVVLNMKDFTVEEYEMRATGLIADENEEKLAGFIDGDDGKFKITMLDGRTFKFGIEYGGPACNCILKGDMLYITDYHPIATGSGLQCFNMKTGKMQWTADVKQVMASHSEYYNTVTLSMYKNKIIMEGVEAYGQYVQIFDAETGERLACVGEFWDLEGE
ncbi:MAG: hypothetical protein C0592_05950 [Marinilabiliales bacterium]|nr:MAG: hypothetical protein C0592_05950 [Marinilabiliales bacterium]